jgi:hypothetical protein
VLTSSSCHLPGKLLKTATASSCFHHLAKGIWEVTGGTLKRERAAHTLPHEFEQIQDLDP